jgi:hypothetical protein
MRNAAVFSFEQALAQYVIDAGLLTDELEDVNTGASAGVLFLSTGVSDPLDERILPENSNESGNTGSASYTNLQRVRGLANQALGALAAYDTVPADTDSAKVLRGELYAYEGYSELMLADLFCSGVPLSTLDYNKDYTYAPSSTRAQVEQDALFKFDTALTLGRASDSVVYLAQVGQGRANLDLGKYAAAADDVSTVPDGFVYQTHGIFGESANISILYNATVSDREGLNGLSYRSNGSVDPRTAVVYTGNNQSGDSLFFPAKYSAAQSGGYAPFTLASGVEARLIQAEAALQATPSAGTWLTILNTLRATVGLGTLSDPGPTNPAAQVQLLFQERAYWLFATGARQGDLRRLLRQYGVLPQDAAFQSQQQVYPTGPYLAPGTGLYGTDVTAPIPQSEYANNLFNGCLDRKP